MIGLEHEFALTIDGISPPVVEYFKRLGIPNRIIYGPRHHVGVGRIDTTSDGLFGFHETGERALIVPEGVPEWPGWDEIHDLIAFMPEDPSRWWRRRGDVDLLGANNMTPWRLSPLTIRETPLSWLRAGADGICIVDWSFDPLDRLVGAADLSAETPALRWQLDRRIKSVASEAFNITDIKEARNVA